ncbi:MAG: YceI family protein [Phycisphaerales bacterium]|nr:YceI family protein [Phycisphaerales bacterium]
MKQVIKATLVTGALLASAGSLAGWNSISNSSEQGVESTAATSVEVAESELRSKTYDLDPTHSGVLFKIRHRGVSNFYGRYNDIQGTIEFDKLRVERTSMTITVQTGSVDTANRTRDGHIKGADFFNTRQYPEATFVSTSVEEKSDGVYTLNGDFTMHGKTVPIVASLHHVDAKSANGSDIMGFEANFSIKRSDFEITKHLDSNDPEGGSLGDIVELTVFVEAVAK